MDYSRDNLIKKSKQELVALLKEINEGKDKKEVKVSGSKQDLIHRLSEYHGQLPDSDKFCFYSRSRDVKPGRGANECLRSEEKAYDELAQVHHWRRMLSNFHLAEFTFKEKIWNSVEHAFQACKLLPVDKEKALELSLDSGSELSKADGANARKQRTAVKLNKEQKKEWDEKKMKIMGKLMYAKFSQNEDLKKVLLLTGEAELWHSPGRAAPERVFVLEQIRSKLRY